MGTSGAFGGSSDQEAKDIRHEVQDWISSSPADGPRSDDGPPSDNSNNDAPEQDSPQQLPFRLPPSVFNNAISLLRPRSPGGSGADGPGGGASSNGGTGRSSGGAQRSMRASASSAGRAAAGAYAFATGNVAALQQLGLDYNELRNIGNPMEVARRIVEAACGARSDSTIEGDEQRYVAADVADWVLTEAATGDTPTPEEITRKTIACIIAEVIDTETGEMLSRGEQPTWVSEIAQDGIREAAEVLANQAELSIDGATPDEFARAIEDGLTTLRNILGVTPDGRLRTAP